MGEPKNQDAKLLGYANRQGFPYNCRNDFRGLPLNLCYTVHLVVRHYWHRTILLAYVPVHQSVV